MDIGYLYFHFVGPLHLGFFEKRLIPSPGIRYGTHQLPIFLIPAFTYFREIFTFQREGDLLKDFTFWFVTASLFIFASTIISRLGLFYLYALESGNYRK